MGYQERRVALIAKRAAAHLEPGERIQTGFIAQTGSLLFTAKIWTFVVTDRAVLIVGGNQVQRLPRDVSFGEPNGMYHRIELDRRYKVHRQYYPEITAANEALRAMRSGEQPEGH
ncbi:hypothetical protein [Amycolatopsis jiangsuensis]|uniref:Uncharacterized protein n=1 Tax=Amycolatopsis jiangsuensis TaxID=1181879 RepID=A0A840IZF3_9PSEU|nr:hypothetical protein [Amycolatopsis jiangsuensis]MBB4686889.1 hypothetical protein [Amycolatopsis jiangsuensis]